MTGTKPRTRERRGRIRARAGVWSRRGVTSVLAMMFLVLFGSLAAAMAIVSKGNIRAAATHLNVTRAMGAAETGLEIAEARLAEAVSRFVIDKGVIDAPLAIKLWDGSVSGGDADVEVLPPKTGYGEFTLPAGIAEAVANIHAADVNIVDEVGITAPAITSAPSGADLTVYRADGWVVTPAVALETIEGAASMPTAFQVTYAPLASGTEVRVIVTGYEFDHIRGEVPITRTLSRDYRIVKQIPHAVISASPVMFGANVMIEGDIGAAYTDTSVENGHPMQIKSDFFDLDPVLDAKLGKLHQQLAAFDVDGDNRLRLNHPIESAGVFEDGVNLNQEDFDGDGSPDEAFKDASKDGQLDDFDLFIRHFDQDGDGRVVLSAELTAGTPADGLPAEFTASDGSPINDDLGLLLDTSVPDRNRNGVFGFVDSNGNGKWDPGEAFNDIDENSGLPADRVLGYRDGVVDWRDRYAKVRGSLLFKVGASQWESDQGPVGEHVKGPIVPGGNSAALEFDAGEDKIPTLTADTFAPEQSALYAAADGTEFWEQVAAQLGVTVGALATYEETSPDPDDPQYFRLDPDADADGRPDNWETAHFEKMPFNSPAFSDWYYRPVFKNMTFKDVRIPKGVNGLFVNCTFVGVTLVETHADNTHPLWTLYGQMTLSESDGRPEPAHPRFVYGDDPGEDQFPDMLDPNDVPVLMATTPLDKADIPADEVAITQGYDDLPAPLLISGLRVIDTKLWSNNLRFHDSLVVGSIVGTIPSQFTHVRNKIQFTGATRFVTQHPDEPENTDLNPEEGDLGEIAKSSLMLPNYSVDVGTFNSPKEQNVQLDGVVIAGVLDVRGNTSIDGALILTFQPVSGEGPLVDVLGNPVGNPANFNSTFGYFGPEDGDEESIDPNDLPEVDGVKIVGWDLDGDGIADLGPGETPTQEQLDAGAVVVPWNGMGGIRIRFNPETLMPDGIKLPLSLEILPFTYHEGSPI